MYFNSELDGLDVDDFYGKSFAITGPGDIHFDVDFDDVDQHAVVIVARQIVGLLNSVWVPLQVRKCANPPDVDYEGDDDWEEREKCAFDYLPLDGPDECPRCGGALEVIDLG